MKKVLSILAWVVATILALNILTVVGVRLYVSSGRAGHMIDRLAAEKIDGSLSYSGYDVSFLKSFPSVRISMDSVSVTYPHGKFAVYDTLVAGRETFLDAGRGEEADTLLSFDTFSIRTNLHNLLVARISVDDIHLSGARFFLHSYSGGHSNMEVFKAGAEEDDADSSSLSIPWIYLERVLIDNTSSVVVTMPESSVYLDASMGSLALQGRFRTVGGNPVLRSLESGAYSLAFKGFVGDNSVSFCADSLVVRQRRNGLFSVDLVSDAVVDIPSKGTFNVPLTLSSYIGFDPKDGGYAFRIPAFDANVAHVPLHLEGELSAFRDSIPMDLKLVVRDVPLDKLAAEYGRIVSKDLSTVSTTARMTLEAGARGVYSSSGGRLPAVEASIDLPESYVEYKPWRTSGKVTLQANGSMTEDRYVTAEVTRLLTRMKGLDIDLAGAVEDLLGVNPEMAFKVKADLESYNIIKILNLDTLLRARGVISIDARAYGCKSDLDSMTFENSSISGNLSSGRLLCALPSDTLTAGMFGTAVEFYSGARGLMLDVDVDSARVRKGKNLQMRVREMCNRGEFFKLESRGVMVPRLQLNHRSRNLFLKSGANRVFVREMDAGVSVQKRVRAVLDSSSLRRIPIHGRKSAGDIDIALDSTFSRYLEEWQPDAFVKMNRGMVITPYLPLRMRLSSLNALFDGEDLTVDTVTASVGSSDVAMKGYVRGLGRALRRRGFLESRVDIRSKKINVNEILAAINLGMETPKDTVMKSETDESLVVDTLQNAKLQTITLEEMLLPSNLSMDISVNVDSVKVTPVEVSPLTATLALHDRTLQFTYAEAQTNRGNLNLSGYFSTPDFDNMTMGADLELSEVSAERIIELMPAVDSIFPVLKSFQGRLGCDAAATCRLNRDMSVSLPSIDGMIRISGEDLNITDAANLRKMTNTLMFRNKDIGHIENLYLSALVHDSRFEVFPFILAVDRYELALSGTQGFDESLNYHASILKSPLPLRLGVNLTGTIQHPVIKLCAPKYKSRNVPVYTEELDSLHANIATSIRDIFSNGAKDIMGLRSYMRNRHWQKDDSTSGTEELSLSEIAVVDSLKFQMQLDRENEELSAEIDSVLRATSVVPPVPVYEEVKGETIFSKFIDSLGSSRARSDGSKESPKGRKESRRSNGKSILSRYKDN